MKIQIEKSLFSLAFVTSDKDHNLDRIKFIPPDSRAFIFLRLLLSVLLSSPALNPALSLAHVDTLSVLITREILKR